MHRDAKEDATGLKMAAATVALMTAIATGSIALQALGLWTQGGLKGMLASMLTGLAYLTVQIGCALREIAKP